MTTQLILAHPFFDASRANRALIDAVRDLPDLQIADLYALYPNGEIDGAAETERLLAADRLILQFPMQWYSTPALLKQWFDVVLTPMFYVTPDVGAELAGRPIMLAVTTASEEEAYSPTGRNGFTVTELFRPIEATARRAGLIWEEPFMLFDVRGSSDDRLAQHGRRYADRVAATSLAEAA